MTSYLSLALRGVALAIAAAIAPLGWATALDSPPLIDHVTRQLHVSPPSQEPLYVWQGFEHEWRRFVLLRDSGRIPHRLSKFHNYIQQPSPDNRHAIFHFAQSTGVDGNFMNPKGGYRVIHSDSMVSQSGYLALNWSDQTQGEDTPFAISRLQETIALPINEETDTEPAFAMILQGIQLDLHCDNQQQPIETPCNSHGMWPYTFHIALDECAHLGDEYACELSVDIQRAWTPNRGGFQLPPFFEEIKPLNHRLDFSLNVHFSLLREDNQQVSMVDEATTLTTHDLHQQQNIKTTVIPHSPSPELTQPVSAITAFGFSLTAPDVLAPHWGQLQSNTQHRGRYIGKLTNRLLDTEDLNGTPETHILQSLWAPITVVNATSHLSLSTLRLWFGQQAQISRSNLVTGKLCINSTDQAPAFSHWKMCDFNGWLATLIYGGKERHTDSRQLPRFTPNTFDIKPR